ncbi:trypsin-like serine peptidase [Streptomyces sp. NPDC050504]|uniref:trypsin-like serine peptidase n=1 Tax=Streptomyces sp. NPDC050504 TaxID=3365618 RepID=UPI00378D80DD
MPEKTPVRKPSDSAPLRPRGRTAGLVAAGTALSLAVPVAAYAAAAPAAPADPASALTYTPAERADALAYWTPARIKSVGRSVDLGPTGPRAHPWRGSALKTVGRLFFVNSRGADTWCTATAVTGSNRSAVMTAAHCVRRGSSPYNTNSTMVFVPGYSKGVQPYGAFAVRTAVTPRSWETDSVNDMAALAVDARVDGRRLTDVVGGQAVAFGRPVGGSVSSFGYSATRPQLGEELLRCVGTAKAKDGAQAVPCDMTGGASGGPWFADFDVRTGRGVLISVNSALDALTPTEMQGEVWGATARQVYERAQRA